MANDDYVPLSDPELLANLVTAVDTAWDVYAGVLVFFMQAGFCMLETGCVRVKNTKGILLKNTLAPAITGAIWWMWGYAIAFGKPADNPDFEVNTIAGHNNFFLINVGTYVNFFFQWTFAAAATTIVSGAIAERARTLAFFFITAVLSLCVYPFIAHWAWGGGWLGTFKTNGYIDFAGSGVVHLTGGAAALMGAIFTGPRTGRFEKGKVKPIPGYSTTLSCLGAFILWFGWYGFNPGSSAGLFNKTIIAGRAAVNTTLAGASAGIGCVLIEFALTRKWDLLMGVNGLLAGLAAITAPCAHVQTWFAVVIGAIAAVIYRIMTFLLIKLRIDDPIDAIPVHFSNGIWGVMSVGLFAQKSFIEQISGKPTDQYGLILGGGWEQLGVQTVGVCTIFAWSGTISMIFFALLRVAKLLRVPEEEEAGSDKHGKDSWARVEIMDGGRLDEFQFRLG